MMNSVLQPEGVFFLFSFFSFCAIFYMYFFVPETVGLTGAAKKKLFYPGAKFGRKLKPDETHFIETTDITCASEIDYKQVVQDDIGNTFLSVSSSKVLTE